MSESKETPEQLIVNWTIRKVGKTDEAADETLTGQAVRIAESNIYGKCINDLARIIPLKESVSPVYDDVQKIRADARTLCIKEIEIAGGHLSPGHRYSEGLKKAVSVLIDG